MIFLFIKRGEIVAILGPNGAGTVTTFSAWSAILTLGIRLVQDVRKVRQHS